MRTDHPLAWAIRKFPHGTTRNRPLREAATLALLWGALSACSAATTVVPLRLPSPGAAEAPPPHRAAVHASEERAAYLSEALAEIDAIVSDPGFRQQLQGFEGQALATSADESCKLTHPLEVLDSLRALPESFGVTTRASLVHWCSLAATSTCGGIAINTGWVDGWAGGDVESRSGVINTLAHEMTHLLPAEGQTCPQAEQRYTDQGHTQCGGAASCSDAFLVSYVWGDLVECAYRVKKGHESDFHHCVMNTVNHGHLSRAAFSFRAPTSSPHPCSSISSWH